MNVAEPRVEVCIWIAKDKNGNYTNAFKGAKADEPAARVGHAAMKIFPPADLVDAYPSLKVAGKDYIYVSLWPKGFNNTHSTDKSNEGGKPNAIIYLNKLNIQKILAILIDDIDTVNWVLKSKKGNAKDHSCASYVLKLLTIGGIYDKTIYGKSASQRGPSRDFYYETNCHLGDMMHGYLNWVPWWSWIISPKFVLNLAASAAESDPFDQEKTLTLMGSKRVEQVENDQTGGVTKKVVGAGFGVASIAVASYLANKKT